MSKVYINGNSVSTGIETLTILNFLKPQLVADATAGVAYYYKILEDGERVRYTSNKGLTIAEVKKRNLDIRKKIINT